MGINLIDKCDQYTGLDRFGRVIDQNWVKTSTGTSAARYQYGYDQDSQVLDRNDLVESALSELYHANSSTSGDNATAYDALGRLTGFARGTLSASGHNGASLDTIASPSATQSWNLDAVGNQTGVTTNGTTVNQTFNTLNQPASTPSGFSTNYDADGNTLVSGHFRLTYDAWNRLVSVRSSLSGAVAASYSYDSLGNRITETDAAGTTTDLSYNADGQVIEERLGSQALGNVHYQSVYGSTGNLILRDTYAGGSIVPSARLYALTDANGDITALTDSSGTVVERYEYSPYGVVTVLDASGTPRTGNVSAYGWQYLFQGGRLDGTTGLYRFGARDYDPSNGVWMQRDPIGLGGGQQDLYGFVGNGPTNFVDPSGMGRDWGQMLWDATQIPIDPVAYINPNAAPRYWGQSLWEGTQIVGGGLAGLAQGTANVINAGDDAAIGTLNLPARLFNNTVGYIPGAPVAGYIPHSDWSRNKFTTEDPLDRMISRGAGDVFIITATMGLGGSGAIPNATIRNVPLIQSLMTESLALQFALVRGTVVIPGSATAATATAGAMNGVLQAEAVGRFNCSTDGGGGGGTPAPKAVPQTLKEVNLRGRVKASGSNLGEAGDFFGWEPSKVIKGIGDFTKDQLLAKGWTKERLLDVAEGYEHIARITPANPSAAGRAVQLRELATLFD